MFRQDIDAMKYFSIGGDSWKDSGCALSCVFYFAEMLKREYYTPRYAMIKSVEMKTVGAIDKDFFVEWDKAFYELGIDTLTTFKDPYYICSDGEYEILELEKPGYFHFVPGDGKGNYSWDSLGIRDAQKDYHVAGKRVFTVKGFV